MISAEFVNISGLIQSGKETFALTLGASQQALIERAKASGANYTNITVANSDFTVVYDRQNDALIIKALRPTGGYIELTGNVMNTQNGKLVAYSGYPQISIVNTMTLAGIDLTLESIDADTRGDGIIMLNDKARNLTTIYTKQANGDVKVDRITIGSSATTTSVLTGGSATSINYNPVTGFRYGWTVGVSSRVKETARWEESGWLGIIDLGTDNIPVDPVKQTLNAALVPNSNYFYRDTANDGDAYMYSSNTVTTESTGWKQTQYSVRKSWYGKKTYTYEYQKIDGLFTSHLHSIEADRPIGISFLHNTSGNIYINAGSADIVVAGKLTNLTGTTTLITSGTISTTATMGGESLASVGGKTVNLTAGTGIGTVLAPLQVDLADAISNTILNASSGGNIYITEVDGILNVGTITAVRNAGTAQESRGLVSLSAAGAILGTSSSLVSGGAIVLNSTAAAIGATATMLRIDTGSGAAHTLTGAAAGGIYVEEITGDLRVFELRTPGQTVSLRIGSGSLMDGNNNAVVDTRAVEELLASVWTDLQLTEETGAGAKVQEAKDSLSAAKTREYQTYWSWRLLQGDNFATVIADSQQIMVLNAEEEAALTQSYAEAALPAGTTWALATDSQKADALVSAGLQVATLKVSRTEQLRTLHA
ncbi:MAG: hypothetical protein Q8L76_11615, partial [Cypionkella sp.]|nr:hypothetical protein [Cypionkella sp.]